MLSSTYIPGCCSSMATQLYMGLIAETDVWPGLGGDGVGACVVYMGASCEMVVCSGAVGGEVGLGMGMMPILA